MKHYEQVTPQYNFENVEHLRHHKSKLVEKIEKGIDKAAQTVKEKVKEAAKSLEPEDALLLPLVPFKTAMINALGAKGIKPKNNHIGTVAKLFLQEVVNKNNFVEHLTAEEKQSIKEQAGTAAKVSAEIAAGDYVDGAKDLIKAIIAYFKGVDEKNKKKRATADELTHKLDAEQGMTKMEQVQTPKEIAQMVTGDKTTTTTGSNKTLLILVGLVIVVYIASK